MQRIFGDAALRPGIRYPEILTEEADAETGILADSFVLPGAAMGDVQAVRSANS